ncbi:MAG TPA: adenylate/guanylate cyclase domain-containing protein [Nocardioidaceae bacterium]|nr:adenylate/guanylate cyclase domain-containing protein [Nocardioidaceae bacterium]
MTEGQDPTLELRPVSVDPVLEALERYLLGGPRTLTRLEVAERVGVSPDRTEALWRALGFTRAADDDVVFSYADVRAVQLALELKDIGVIDEERETALARTLGRTFNRLAEWQTRLLAELLEGAAGTDPEAVVALAEVAIPKLEELQGYLWRRAIIANTSRMLLHPTGDEGTVLTVGFVDIVGYTSQSRLLSESELEQLVEHFESVSNHVCTEYDGRIVKTIGDEVLFVAYEPAQGARIALDLVERHALDEHYPLVRAGVAHGPVLSRLGDVFGSVVNMAARLTTVARPGRVLVDRRMREELEGLEEFELRRMRRTSVKGFDRLEPTRLKRPRDTDEEHEGMLRTRAAGLREAIEETIDEVTPDVVKRRRS